MIDLLEIYGKYFNGKRSHVAGIDRITLKKFESIKERELELVCKKIEHGEYKFANYKEYLISKGANKNPRIISIPTIKDKIVLKYLLLEIEKKYNINYGVNMYLPQHIIANLFNVIKSLKRIYFIKIDLSNFYGTINHNILIKKLIKDNMLDSNTIKLIEKAIKNQTIKMGERYKTQQSKIGIPQGLAISNILASIYLLEIDGLFNKYNRISYFRYVDDIVMISSNKCFLKLYYLFFKICIFKLKLKENKDKTISSPKELKGKTNFTYLGYSFSEKKVSIKKENIQKMESRIEGIFVKFANEIRNINEKYQYESEADRGKQINREYVRLKWNLNVMVTGAIFDARVYGWIPYFLKINDLEQLHKLDWFINNRMISRFKLNVEKLKNAVLSGIVNKEIKSFVDVFKDYQKNTARKSLLILNVDDSVWTTDLKKVFLVEIVGLNENEVNMAYSDKKINFIFNKNIYSYIKTMEEDVNDSRS